VHQVGFTILVDAECTLPIPYTRISQTFWISEHFELGKYLRKRYVMWFPIHQINASATGFVSKQMTGPYNYHIMNGVLIYVKMCYIQIS
jgi:hypothetical protein